MRMGRSLVQVAIVMMLAAFGVFFGIDMATRGMEKMNGALPGGVAPAATGGPVAAVSGQVASGMAQTQTQPEATPPARRLGQRVQAAESPTPTPVPTPTPRTVAPALRPAPVQPDPADLYPQEPAIAQFGNSVGDLLHHTAYRVVDGVASLFSKITD